MAALIHNPLSHVTLSTDLVSREHKECVRKNILSDMNIGLVLLVASHDKEEF